MLSSSDLTKQIVGKALSLGASMAGVAGIESLKESPSHRIYPEIGMNLDAHWPDVTDHDRSEKVAWPANAVSAVIIGVAHPTGQPELDWWDGKGTSGNRILMRINKELSAWIESTFSIKTYKLPYMIERGGIFLKDAAVMAGLGCIGKNNLVITPEYGPRIRLRALLLDREAEATGPLAFNPCEDCERPCRKACPVKAFEYTVYSADDFEQLLLPGIDGTYDRVTCNVKMEQDIEEALMAISAGDEEHQALRRAVDKFEEGGMAKEQADTKYCVKYCRRCELSCPVGNWIL